MEVEYTNPRTQHPGLNQALRFQLGLILQLAWRNPMRARNWCEALLGHNLKQDQQGQWRWRFVGEEMKIGMRMHGTRVNVFDPMCPLMSRSISMNFSPTIDPISRMPRRIDTSLSQQGTQIARDNLLLQLKVHVNRYTNKHLYTHLSRSLFSTHHLSRGVDINLRCLRHERYTS